MLIKDHKFITREELAFASSIWDFLCFQEKIQNSDLILVFGSHDVRVADHAIKLFKLGFADKILFSGGLNFFTKNIFQYSEADTFASRAKAAGIPERNILIEDKSTNTGENIAYSKNLLPSINFYPESILAIQKPSMTFRMKLALEKQWIGPVFQISSPEYHLLDAPHEYMNLFMLINEIVGDLQRIQTYPRLGYQAETWIPESILFAQNFLISKGYNLHLCEGAV